MIPSNLSSLSRVLAICSLPFIAASAHAQASATVKVDGQWHSALGAGFTNSTGNTRATTINFSGDAARVTEANKWSIYGTALDSKSNGAETGRQARAGTRYDRNLSAFTFAFFGADLEHDRIAALKLRASGNTGIGYKLVNTPDNTFNLLGGVGYTYDRYDDFRLIDEQTRNRYSYWSGILGEESTHKFNDTVSARQKLSLLPVLNGSGAFRATFDTALSVAMTRSMTLNVGFNARHNSDPGVGLKKTDTLLTTGIAVKFD